MAEKVLGFRIEVKGTDKQTSEMARLKTETNKMKLAINKLNKAERDFEKGKKGAIALTKKQTIEREKLTAAVNKNNQAYKKLQIETGQATSFTKKLGKSIVGAGVAMFGIGAAISLVTRLISGAVNIIIDFEKANSKLEAVLGATEIQMAALSDQARQLGSTTAFTASQVTELQTEFAKLGFPTEDILKMTEATLNGAAALGSGLAEQAALTGATLKQYGLDASNAAEVNNILATAAANSALDFAKLSTALPIVGATAKAVGVNLKETTSLLGKLADRGLDASTAGTSLRNVFLRLTEHGLTMDQAMIKINTSTDKAKTSMELFGTRGATTGLILADMEGKTTKLDEALVSVDGAAKRMAETMLDNLAGDVTKAKSAWEGFILSLDGSESVIGNTLRSIVQFGTGALRELQNLDIFWKGTFGSIGDFTDDQMKRTLESTSIFVTEAGVGLGKIKEAFDKIPFDKMVNNVDEVKEKWIELLGGDRQDALLLFNGYLKDRISIEKELVKATSDRSDAEGDAAEKSSKSTEILTDKEIAANKKKNDKILKEKTKLLEKLKKAEEKELEGEEERLDQDFEMFVNNEIRKKDQAELLREEEKERQRVIDEENFQLTIEANAKEIEDAREQQRLIEEAKKQQRDIGFESATKAVSLFSAFQQQEADRALIKVDKNTKKEIALLQDKLDRGIIDQEKFDKEKGRIERDAASKASKIKKEAFEKQRDASVIEAIIASSLGVVKASPVVPLMIAAGIAGAAEIALIAGQPTPEFHDGGYVDGASHAQGGIQMYHKGGQHIGEMEGKEYIMSSKTVDRIGIDNLDAINFGSGTSNGFFQEGGLVPDVSDIAQSQTSAANLFDMETLANLISTQMQEAIIRTPVINTATDTAEIAASVTNIESELSFG